MVLVVVLFKAVENGEDLHKGGESCAILEGGRVKVQTTC